MALLLLFGSETSPPPRLLMKGFGYGGVGNRKFRTLYLPVIIRVIKFRRVGWAGCVARMGRREMRTGFKWAGLKGGDQWENVAINGRIILKWFCNMMGYIGLFHQAVSKWPPVNTVMNLLIWWKLLEFLSDCIPLTFQEGLCSWIEIFGLLRCDAFYLGSLIITFRKSLLLAPIFMMYSEPYSWLDCGDENKCFHVLRIKLEGVQSVVRKPKTGDWSVSGLWHLEFRRWSVWVKWEKW